MDDFNEILTIFCLWLVVNLQFISPSHLSFQDRYGCSGGVISRPYIFESVCVKVPSSEQHFSNMDNCRPNLFGGFNESRKWWSCKVFQNGKPKGPEGSINAAMDGQPSSSRKSDARRQFVARWRNDGLSSLGGKSRIPEDGHQRRIHWLERSFGNHLWTGTYCRAYQRVNL